MAETYQGAVCKRGHTTRYKSNDSCVDCNTMLTRLHREKWKATQVSPFQEEQERYESSVALFNRLLTSRWSALI